MNEEKTQEKSISYATFTNNINSTNSTNSINNIKEELKLVLETFLPEIKRIPLKIIQITVKHLLRR